MANEVKQYEELECTNDVINIVVGKLMQIVRESTLDYAIRVGSLIVHYFYLGDMKLWRRKGPKTTSFRRLAEHASLPMSPSALYRCVAIYDLCERLNAISRWHRLSASHLRIVLRLSEEDQTRLLSAANAANWSVQRLQTEARNLQSGSEGQGPRTPVPLKQNVKRIERIMEATSAYLKSSSDLQPVLDGVYDSFRTAVAGALCQLERARDVLVRPPRDEGECDAVDVDEAEEFLQTGGLGDTASAIATVRKR